MQQPSKSQASTRDVQTVRAPQSRAELDALEMRRSELRNQLEAIGDRRGELTDQLHALEGDSRRVIESAIQTMDNRTARLEQQLLETDDAITEAVTRGIMTTQRFHDLTTQERSSGNVGEVVAGAMFGEALIFVLLGIVLFRRVRRRGPVPAMRLAPEEAARLDQLQRAVDVIAVEVERISEGQRYVTKMFSDKSALGAGPAQDVQAPRREGLPARKQDSAS